MTLTNSNIKMSHQNMWKDNVQENKSYNLGEVITTQLLCRINKDFYRQIKKKLIENCTENSNRCLTEKEIELRNWEM